MGKWDNYTIGSVPWINSRRDRLKNCPFVYDVINDNDIKSVLEIGGGELVEAKRIKDVKDCHYNVVDISKTFCHNAKKNGFNVVNADFEKYNGGCEYDMIYANHVLEHMENVETVIKKICSIGKRYHVCMFKWRFVGNTGLTPAWEPKKGYWSTSWNIWSIISLFGDSLSDIYITDKENNRIEWDSYVETVKGMDNHRDGNHYLHLVGKQ